MSKVEILDCSKEFSARNTLPYHCNALMRITRILAARKHVLGVIAAGSIAHGNPAPDSDIDIMIVVSDKEYEERYRKNKTTFLELAAVTACRYKGGYIDGKYISPGYLHTVAERGNEASRFAFEGAFPTYERDSNITCLCDAIKKASLYPEKELSSKLKRFSAQIEGWNWYAHEGIKRQDDYLTDHAVHKMAYFAGRLVLAHNRELFPYHKWFMRALLGVKEKPKNFMEKWNAMIASRDTPSITAFYKAIRSFKPWPFGKYDWPPYFIDDSELSWKKGHTPIDDL